MVSLGGTSLTGLGVGQSVPVTWANTQAPATLRQMEVGTLDHIVLYNESGTGLNIQFNNTGRSFTLPAGGWTYDPIPVSYRGTNDTGLTATAIYILGGAQVSTLYCDYFVPGEQQLRIGTLGNSPIGGTVTVGTTPLIEFEPVNFPLPLTSTVATNLFSFSIPATGLYAIYGSFIVNNGGVATISISAQFTSGFDATVLTRTLAKQDGATLSALVLANGTYGLAVATLNCRFGTNLTLIYQDSTNTPSDNIFASVMKMF